MRSSPPLQAPAPSARDPHGTYSPSRRAGQPDWLGPELDRAERRTRRTLILIVTPVVAAVTIAALGGIAYSMWPSHARGPRQPAVRDGSAPSADTPSATPPPTVSAKKVMIPQKGTGTYTVAGGGTDRVGHGGKLVRYSVRVENGLHQDAGAFARTVDKILAAPRGWTTGGKWSFQRVSAGPADFTITLASPVTSTALCAAGYMDTGGIVNCSAPGDVVINLKRWILLTPYYQGNADLYHALAINHEVGHRLGFGHMKCPGQGSPAPVMMQQIYGLHGCVINGWPYTAKGVLITGPPTP